MAGRTAAQAASEPRRTGILDEPVARRRERERRSEPQDEIGSRGQRVTSTPGRVRTNTGQCQR